MYPVPQPPIPTTSGFVPHRPSSTFKPIHPAAPSTASGSATQGSFNTLLGMVDSTQETGSSQDSSIPCAQKSPATSQPSPASTQGTSTQSNTAITTTKCCTRSTFCSKHSTLSAVTYCIPATGTAVTAPIPGSHAVPMQQGQL